MNNNSKNEFLEFEETEQKTNLGELQTTEREESNTDEVNFTAEDFAILARQAHGFNTDSDTNHSSVESHQEEEKEKIDDTSSSFDHTKVGLRKPYRSNLPMEILQYLLALR